MSSTNMSYSATGIVQLTQQLPQQPICLGDEVVYLCTVPGNAIIWGTPVGDFAVTEGTETPQQGGYVARKVRYDGINNCLTASLAFIAENQTMITCENSARSLQNSTTIGLEGQYTKWSLYTFQSISHFRHQISEAN